MDESTLYFQKTANLKILNLNKDSIKEKTVIGTGGFGKVLCGNYLSIQTAIKKLKNVNYKEFYKEISLIHKFKHKFVPSCYGISIKDKKSPIIINELIKGEHIDKYIISKSPPAVQILLHLLDLCSVLEYLHSYNFIHRDLKPLNVMLDENLNTRLLDFGISKVADQTITNTMAIGTLMYMAPENFQAPVGSGSTATETWRSNISTKVDIWALGCIISQLFSKERPWKDLNDNQILSCLVNKTKFKIPNSITDENVVLLIDSCLKINVFERADVRQVKQCLLKILYDNVRKSDKTTFFSATIKPRQTLNLMLKLYFYLEEYKKYYSEHLSRMRLNICQVIHIEDDYLYSKDYRKILCSQVRDNCIKILTYLEEKVEIPCCKKTSSKGKTEEDSENYAKTRSTAFMTFEPEWSITKKKERKDSDSSSSEDDDDGKYGRSVSKVEDNIAEMLKKDFGYSNN